MFLPGLRYSLYNVIAAEGEGGGAGPSTPSSPSTAAPAPASTSSPSAAAPSGGSPTPSGTPASQVPATPASTPEPATSTTSPDASGGVEGLFDFDEEFGVAAPPVAPPSTPPQAQAPAAPEAPKAPEPATQPPPAPAAPQAQPEVQQPAAAPGQQEVRPLPTPAEPLGIATQLEANRDFLVAELAKSRFVLSPEEVEALAEDAPTAVPKLLAKVYLESQINVMKQVAQIVPAMFKTLSEAKNRSSENETKFYTRWPDLKKDQHGELVARTAAMFRQMNPKMPLEQMIEEVGPMVMHLAKVQPSAAPAAAPGAPAPRQPPAPPFRPAIGGGPSAPPSPDAAGPWDWMGQEPE